MSSYGTRPIALDDSDITRFWSRVEFGQGIHDCWIWIGARGKYGHGTFSVRGSSHSAHRISYVIHAGTIPSGYVVMHICDNPPCVNPRHLHAGSQRENILDASRKGRLIGRKIRGPSLN